MAVDHRLPALGLCRAAELAAQPPEDHWLVQDVWGRTAAGLLGGEPKVCKSWFGLDMAVSVASGTPFLRRFHVDHPGPALVFLAEDELPAVRARIDAICGSRRQPIEGLALHVITEPVLRLDLDRDQQRLADAIEHVGPHFVLLDPLVRLHRLDENSASEISGLLGYFRELQRRFECAVMITHHTGKKRRSHPGQCLRGSSDLHAFGASNAYLSRVDEERIVLQLEHRTARAPGAIQLRLAGEDERTQHLQVVEGSTDLAADGDLVEGVLAALADAAEPLSGAALRRTLRVNNQRLHDSLADLQRRGLIVREHGGWRSSAPPAEGPSGPPRQAELFD